MLIQGIVAGYFFTMAALGADRWRRRGDKDSLWLMLLGAAAGALMLLPRTPWYLLLISTLGILVLVVLGVRVLHRTPSGTRP